MAVLGLAGSLLAGSAAAQDRPDVPPVSAGPVVTCPPAPGPITVDGDLREWNLGHPVEIGPDQLVRRSAGYAGAADLSGRIHVCRSATTLYVAGEVQDDKVFWNPEVSWRGDGVELFLDFRRDAAPRASDAYDEDTYQILLHPLAGEVRWQFAWYRGRPGRMDDAVDGIELAGMRFQDERGATVGYRFEVALPLANFPGAPASKGESFGFDVALSDSDGLPEQRNYATWSGRSDLSRFPSRFGRLVLGDDPPPVAPAPPGTGTVLLPIAFLAVLLGLALSVWLARGLATRESRLAEGLVRLGGCPARWKFGASAALLALIVLAGPATSLVAAGLARSDLSQRRETAALLREIAAEAVSVGLQRPLPPAHPSPLLSLLAGQTVKPPADFEYTVLPPLAISPDGSTGPEPTSRTLGGVPFLRRDIPATAAWSGAFLVHPPTGAEAATVVYSWQPDPGSDVPPRPGEVVAEVRFVHLDGTVDPPVELAWGRHVDAWNDPTAAPGSGHPGAPESEIAFVGTVEGSSGPTNSHADALRVPLAAAESPVVRIEVEQKAQGGRFTTHGVTLHPPGRDPLPLPLGRATRSGIPTAASPFPAPDAGLLLLRTSPRATIPCDAAAERLWLVVSLRRGFPDSRLGQPVLAVRAEFDDGSVEGPFPLENGVDVDAETSPPRQHGEKFRSEVAFEWGLPDEPRRHADVWSVALGRPGRRLARIHLEFRGEDEVVRVSSVVLGTPGRGPRPEKLLRLEATADGYRVSPALLERFSGIDLTTFRDGAAYATSLGGAERDRALARTVGDRVVAAVTRAPEGIHETRVVDGRRLHTLSVPLPGTRSGTFVEMAWAGEAEDSLHDAVFRVRAALGILLAPLLVLAAADLILRLRSLHTRLVAVCTAIAAIPAVLGFFAVPELVGGKIEDAERAAVLEKAAAVKGRLAALPGEARKRAEAALGDEALQEALKRRGLEDYRATVTAALRDLERNVSAETVPGARVVLDVVRLSGPAERNVFPPEVQFTVFRDRASQVTDTLAYRWSRLTARGVAPQFDTEGDWQTTLVVDLPVDRAALEGAASAAGGDVKVYVYTPRGYPLVETGARVAGDESQGEMERKVALAQRVLAEQQPFVETRVLGGSLYTVAYDVLRGESGDVSLVATALPRTGADALLARVGQTSLLVFGAGVVAQFLLLGLVAVATSRPLRRVVERASPQVPGAQEHDEVTALSDAVSGLQAERDVYRGEMARLSDAVARLSRAQDPDAVVAGAVDLVRSAVTPWGAVLVTAEVDGRLEVAGGFRGGEAIPRMPVVVDEHSPLQDAIRGRRAARIPAIGAVADALSRDERRLFEGAASLDAFPLAGEDDHGGALVLLERPGGPGAPRRFHAEFLEALARQVGLSLGSARLVRLAVRDRETGVSVASYFGERLREEVDRAVAAHRPIALVFVAATSPPADPAAARSAAQRLADRIRAAAPGRAFLGRLEPFTFAVAVPEADRAASDALATVLRRAASEPGLAELRVRVGAAACPEDAGSSEFLQAEARRRLADTGGSDASRPAVEPDAGDRLVAEARRLGAVFTSPEGRALLETVERIAASDLTILLEGETGVGKEVVADLVHRKSPRRDRPLVKVNCAALPDTLLESELFGFERGAFTGAERSKPGRFELADGGTLFLDEVGEMPLATQAKLLRVLEDRHVEHLGGTKPIAVNVRVIVATNRDLGRMVNEGRFREDLWYRLNGVTIAIPPLRARKEDIPVLAEAFLRSAAETHGRRPPTLQPDAMDLLYRHDWPGNVRELRNLMEQAVVLTPGDTLRAADLLPALGKSPRRPGGEAPRGGARETARDTAPAAPGAPSLPYAPDSDSPAAVSDRQRRLLALMAERTWITTSEYCEIVGVSPRTALRDVRELVERGVIVMEGKRRGARYRLP
jgi:DNA-binding NtrC family response regulator